MLPAAAAPDAKGTGQAAEKKAPGEGLSAFLGRVLDQLSLSSWMPAAMLVGNAAFLLTLHSQEDGLAPGKALQELTSNTFGLVVVLIFALVLATIVTQAFEFEVIRFLEGYLDSAVWPMPLLAAKRIRRHERKRSGMLTDLQESEQAAFIQARLAMLNLPTPPLDRASLDIIEDEIFQRKHPSDLDEGLRKEALAFDWSRYVQADVLYHVDGLDARVGAYPEPHRLLPTRLGNILRAAEDKLPLAPGENLEGFVIRHHDALPEILQTEHRDYRTRLNMYCSLVLVFLALTMLSAIALAPRAAVWVTAAVATGYSVLTCVSYEAAIASARGYGAVLLEIGRRVKRAAEEERLSTANSHSRSRWLRSRFHWHLM